MKPAAFSRLHRTFTKRKWVMWVALALVLLIVLQLGLALVPHHVLNSMLQYEEKSNGVRELSGGGRGAPK